MRKCITACAPCLRSPLRGLCTTPAEQRIQEEQAQGSFDVRKNPVSVPARARMRVCVCVWVCKLYVCARCTCVQDVRVCKTCACERACARARDCVCVCVRAQAMCVCKMYVCARHVRAGERARVYVCVRACARVCAAGRMFPYRRHATLRPGTCGYILFIFYSYNSLSLNSCEWCTSVVPASPAWSMCRLRMKSLWRNCQPQQARTH